MAKRRMISAELMRSDAFLELPPESQLLYVHLLVEADDDGFLRGKKYVLAMLGLAEDAFTALAQAGFLIVFPTGSAVIAHWPLMNKVPKDRYTPTRCRAEMARQSRIICLKMPFSGRQSAARSHTSPPAVRRRIILTGAPVC